MVRNARGGSGRRGILRPEGKCRSVVRVWTEEVSQMAVSAILKVFIMINTVESWPGGAGSELGRR